MGASYIDEVMAGVTERRIAGPEQNGILLAESFKRHFQDPAAKAPDSGSDFTVSEVTAFALAFNTTITGHPCHESRNLCRLFGGDRQADGLYKNHAGGRLVITNLPADYFPRMGPEYAKDAFLKYVVLNNKYAAYFDEVEYESVPLFAAAAMSANFLPVFSDAGIEVHGPRPGNAAVNQFWVTDGGALDNRGVLTLLFALDRAVHRINDPTKLPELHIVVADASKQSIDYNHIRGFGGMLGASCHLASQLANHLVEKINARVGELKNGGRSISEGDEKYVQVHYIEMPYALRMRGGLGTHWKLPKEFAVSDPTIMSKKAAKKSRIKVEREEALEAIAHIHSQERCETHGGRKILSWICTKESEFHPDSWQTLIAGLKTN
jgi:hypothetical protein